MPPQATGGSTRENGRFHKRKSRPFDCNRLQSSFRQDPTARRAVLALPPPYSRAFWPYHPIRSIGKNGSGDAWIMFTKPS